VFAGPLALARAPVELAEAEVAVGDERAHAEVVGECQGLAVGAFSVLGAAGRRDTTGEAEGVSLDRLAEPLDRHGPERADLDAALGQLHRLGGESDAAGRGELLHASGEVRGLTPAGNSTPHLEQVGVRRAPHSKQKRDCAGFSCWHRRHLMPGLTVAPATPVGGIAEIQLV
jgi:hypothetical protein